MLILTPLDMLLHNSSTTTSSLDTILVTRASRILSVLMAFHENDILVVPSDLFM